VPELALEAVVGAIGGKLRQVRQQKGLSMQQLANRSGVSPAAIHKIEHSHMIPTITTLMKLAAALNRSVAFFVDEEDIGRPAVFTPAAERKPVLTSKHGLELESISGPYGQFLLAGAVATLEHGADSGPQAMEHPGEELVHVLDGRIEICVDDDMYRLGVGDSLHFRTDRPHRWRNLADGPTRAVWMAFRTR
jgi:transcriptional regulator with XRE-family HTH domain